jgi:hypothetical protein
MRGFVPALAAASRDVFLRVSPHCCDIAAPDVEARALLRPTVGARSVMQLRAIDAQTKSYPELPSPKHSGSQARHSKGLLWLLSSRRTPGPIFSASLAVRH